MRVRGRLHRPAALAEGRDGPLSMEEEKVRNLKKPLEVWVATLRVGLKPPVPSLCGVIGLETRSERRFMVIPELD